IYFLLSQVYLNIVGGLKVQETASDLAVALAIVSSYATVPVRSTERKDTCFVGEIGLGGELRPVQQLDRRIQVRCAARRQHSLTK
ncbi:unnamed protein product, partial [Ascophyllum nodosum]